MQLLLLVVMSKGLLAQCSTDWQRLVLLLLLLLELLLLLLSAAMTAGVVVLLLTALAPTSWLTMAI
jgi:hypothetical protein